jgi:orotate phosphoribosyltransferase
VSVPDFDLHAALAQRGALLEGHFRLSSGRHSDRFVQKFRMLEDPRLLEPIASAIAQRFRTAATTVVVGAAVGGILLAYEVARQLGTRAIFVEKESGAPALRRGFALDAHDRALLVEDVLTTGLSMRETIAVVRAHGAHVVGLGVIVSRAESGAAAVLGSDANVPFPVHALLELPLRSYDPAECPQCKAALALSDPGSRRA